MRNLILIVFATFLTACIPLKQTQVVGGRGYDNFGYFADIGYGLLQIGPSNMPKHISVVDSGSYAVNPNGIRLGIESEPHDYDIETKDRKVPYVRDRIYVIDTQGHRVTRPLKDGKWKFHFTIRTPNGIQTRDFEAKLWTFYYNPIIHGPPL